ncbi:hypothetical protein [Enterobacter asburiae]|uniref:hypothetical protein n=1 Tax=Enterobacter asburiae TaxID=61645 RepID=UPI0020037C71|nr:hypothetical protein [Enterobacter asburiae]MCK6677644.1 hypothetical protein [Enterobacter asburiae]
MLKPKQQAIVDFLTVSKKATPQMVRQLLSCDIKEAYDRLKRLAISGITENVGQKYRPEYSLVCDWETRIKPAPVERVVKPVAKVCRENWQGYQIHKIFGSAQK